eukprot:COSAG03_NODE_9506_length_714_cov_1.372358_1_plen_88_part_10
MQITCKRVEFVCGDYDRREFVCEYSMRSGHVDRALLLKPERCGVNSDELVSRRHRHEPREREREREREGGREREREGGREREGERERE